MCDTDLMCLPIVVPDSELGSGRRPDISFASRLGFEDVMGDPGSFGVSDRAHRSRLYRIKMRGYERRKGDVPANNRSLSGIA